jgi:DNA-binding transcriptional LysR family regulator
MELRHLRYFIAVVEERNFTRAAERLHVAQPGISAQIKQLERELGQPLLDRAERSVRLTAAGEAFLPYARAALDATTSGAASVTALSGLIKGHLRIGTVASISSTALDLPALLAGFHSAHPGVDIALQEDATTALLAGIGEGRLDAAFVGLSATKQLSEIDSVGIVRERLVAVMLACTDSAKPRQVPITQLAQHSLIVPREGTGLRNRLNAAFAKAGVQPRIAFESGEPNLLVRLARAGLGTAIVPASVIARHHDPALASAVLTPRIDGQISIAWHRSRPLSPAAREFIAHVRHQTQDRAGE